MIGCKIRVLCRNLFRRLEILPFVSQYILSLMLFVVRNKNLYILNSQNHTKSTKQFNNCYQLITNHTRGWSKSLCAPDDYNTIVRCRETFWSPCVYQRAVHNVGIKIFNNLPPYIKDISNNIRKFEICLKQFLHTHSFYSIEAYFQYKSITSW
jgi:hypothetical protein